MPQVYVMDDGLHRKIGISDNPAVRAKEVRRSAPVRVVFAQEAPECRRVERKAHLILADRHVGGEWFSVSIEEAVDVVMRAMNDPHVPEDLRTGDRHAGTAKTIRLTDDELAVLEAIKAKAGGTYAEAIAVAGQVYLGQNDITQADVLRWIKEHST